MKFSTALSLLSVAAYSGALAVQFNGLGDYWGMFMVSGGILCLWSWLDGWKS
jgi:hypothetical protein